MFRLRFKRWQQQHVFLVHDESKAFRWGVKLLPLPQQVIQFPTVQDAEAVIEQIQALEVPKLAIDFNYSTLFLMKLFGKDWDDSVEGMLLDMDDVIKAQILDEHGEVVATHRLRNPIWEKHYA